MMQRIHILSFACFLALFIGCAQQDESPQYKEVAVEENVEEAASSNPEANRIASNEILESKHYWKLGKQKVEDLIDLTNMLLDSTVDESIKIMIEEEMNNLVHDSLINLEDAKHHLKEVRKIKSVKDRLELEDCDYGLGCFSMKFHLKRKDTSVEELWIYFVLSEEIQQFGSEEGVVRKLRISSILNPKNID